MDDKAYVENMKHEDDAVAVEGGAFDVAGVQCECVTITAKHGELAGSFLDSWSFARGVDDEGRRYVLFASDKGDAPRVFLDAIQSRLDGSLLVVR